MPEFLELLPPSEALARLFDHLTPVKSRRVEMVPTTRAAGRVTASPVYAAERLPAFSRSTVDGYAVQSRDTFGASDGLPAYLTLAGEVMMGTEPSFTLTTGQVAQIHTGGMLPQGADAVVMLEYTQFAREREVEILRPVAPGENVLLAGEDVESGAQVLPGGQKLGPAEIGGLMALGILEVEAVQPPLVGVISSGDEVVSPDRSPAWGQVRDVNSYSLSALIETHGGKARRYGILPDLAEALENAIRRALDECDLVVITAGSSASTRDLTAAAIQKMGRPGVLVHGVNVKPGKPTILGVCSGKAVIGLPGNPVSALVIAGLFVAPVIESLLGLPSNRPTPGVPARLSINLPSQAGREDFIPVRLVAGADGFLAEPIFYKSNLIFTLARADGLVRIPADANGLEAGSEVLVYPI